MPKINLDPKDDTGDCPKCLTTSSVNIHTVGPYTSWKECIQCGNWWTPAGDDSGRSPK